MEFSAPPPSVDTDLAIESAILATIPDAQVQVRGDGGHFEISVQATAFENKSMLEQHRMVYRAIGSLMAGDYAPVHAVDKLETSTPHKLITLSDSAMREVRRLVAAESERSVGLRLGIRGGGCSGLSYSLEFTERRDGDTVLSYDGFEVYLDPKSTIYLGGVTLDYQGGLSGKGFVFQNPHATNTCGCGESFAL